MSDSNQPEAASNSGAGPSGHVAGNAVLRDTSGQYVHLESDPLLRGRWTCRSGRIGTCIAFVRCFIALCFGLSAAPLLQSRCSQVIPSVVLWTMWAAMNTSEPTPDRMAARSGDLSKAIADLDAIVAALLTAVPQSKPWQRQLRTHLVQLEREVQVLRMTLLMSRSDAELAQAAAAANHTLRAANTYVAAGRAEIGTKAAVRLAFELGERIDRLVDGLAG